MPFLPATSDDRPVARLSSSSELVAAVPQMCGFVPQESLVLLSLHGPRKRVGLTIRIDLPPEEHEPSLAAEMVARLRHERADGALVVVYTEAPDGRGLPRARMLRRLARQLHRAGVVPVGQLLVRDGRWWSYDCAAPHCCPPEGTPVEPRHSRALDLLAAHRVLKGSPVLASRTDLAATLAVPTGEDVGERLDAAATARSHQLAEQGRVEVACQALRLWSRCARRAAQAPGDGRPTEEAAAALVVSLADVLVRDEVLSWALELDEALLTLLLQLAARSIPPHDVPVCTLIGWVAHLRGDGALANVALDRALAGDPSYGMALLSRQALDGQVGPAQVRALLADARVLLRQQHPWTACHER